MSKSPETLSPAKIDKDYREVLTKFSKTLLHSMWASGKANNLNAGDRHYWGSVLFTRIVLISTSILTLCPESELCSTKNWDFGSVASLVRNLHECSLMFFYLAIETISSDEWRARLNVMQLHDNSERHRMFSDLSSTGSDSDDHIYQLHQTDLKNRLLANSFFLSLDKGVQKKLLKAESAKILTFKEISERMGDGKKFIWGWYRFFSSHTHTTPLSFYRLSEQGRTGVENDIDKAYKTLALDFANQVLTRTLNDFTVSFSDLVEFDFANAPTSFRFLLKNYSTNPQSLPTFQARGRNDPCYCGSGKKYKRCHGA